MMDEPPRLDHDGMGDVIPCACGCGETLRQFDDRGRERRYRYGHTMRKFWKAYREMERRTTEPRHE